MRLIVVLLRLRPHSRFVVSVKIDVNHVCTTADGAILDVFLSGARRSIDGDDDLLATCIAGITRFVNHPGDSTGTTAPLEWETTLWSGFLLSDGRL